MARKPVVATNPLEKLASLLAHEDTLAPILRAAWNAAHPDSPLGPDSPLPPTFADSLASWKLARETFEGLSASLVKLAALATERKAKRDAATAMARIPGMSAATIATTLGMLESDVREIMAPTVAAPTVAAPTVAATPAPAAATPAVAAPVAAT
jgi:hypothetical protein